MSSADQHSRSVSGSERASSTSVKDGREDVSGCLGEIYQLYHVDFLLLDICTASGAHYSGHLWDFKYIKSRV